MLSRAFLLKFTRPVQDLDRNRSAWPFDACSGSDSLSRIGCGIAVVVVPTYLSEIAPPERKGSIGVLNQLGIVTGILLGQSASLALASTTSWQCVFLISAVIAVAHVLASGKAVESPIWLAGLASAESAGESECMRDSLFKPLLMQTSISCTASGRGECRCSSSSGLAKPGST